MKLLFIDATLNKEKPSRTYQLCQSFLNEFKANHTEYDLLHLILNEEELKPVTWDDIQEREALVSSQEFEHPALKYAKEFAEADCIVIGAPYWELSFPAILKIYMERVSVCDIAFCYTEAGIKGLCCAKHMIYLTTSGGYLGAYDFGTDYLKGMCEGLFGITEFHTVNAQGLDIVGTDVTKELEDGCKRTTSLAKFISNT